MNEPKWTPGPWYPGHLGSDGTTCECRYILDEGHAGGIATVHINNGIPSIGDGGNDAPTRDQAIGNMHLIAAAPELYDALLKLWREADGGEITGETLNHAQAVLIKARGE